MSAPAAPPRTASAPAAPKPAGPGLSDPGLADPGLAGPILRRVEARRVVLWLASTRPLRARIVLHPDGGGEFESVTLRPRVTIAPDSDRELAVALHEDAGRLCFIARTVRTPVHHEPTVEVAGG